MHPTATALFPALAIREGAFVEGPSRALIGGLSFGFLASTWLLYLAGSVFSTGGNYPRTICGNALSAVFTFVPLAFVADCRATVLLDRTTALQVSPVLAYLAPLVRSSWLTTSIQFFRRQIGQYQSAGN